MRVCPFEARHGSGWDESHDRAIQSTLAEGRKFTLGVRTRQVLPALSTRATQARSVGGDIETKTPSAQLPRAAAPAPHVQRTGSGSEFRDRPSSGHLGSCGGSGGSAAGAVGSVPARVLLSGAGPTLPHPAPASTTASLSAAAAHPRRRGEVSARGLSRGLGPLVRPAGAAHSGGHGAVGDSARLVPVRARRLRGPGPERPSADPRSVTAASGRRWSTGRPGWGLG